MGHIVFREEEREEEPVATLLLPSQLTGSVLPAFRVAFPTSNPNLENPSQVCPVIPNSSKLMIEINYHKGEQHGPHGCNKLSPWQL